MFVESLSKHTLQEYSPQSSNRNTLASQSYERYIVHPSPLGLHVFVGQRTTEGL